MLLGVLAPLRQRRVLAVETRSLPLLRLVHARDCRVQYRHKQADGLLDDLRRVALLVARRAKGLRLHLGDVSEHLRRLAMLGRLDTGLLLETPLGCKKLLVDADDLRLGGDDMLVVHIQLLPQHPHLRKVHLLERALEVR